MRFLCKILISGSLLCIVCITLIYFYFNKEIKEIDDSVRSSSNGKFIKLSQGFVHYDLKGNTNDPTVILIHGAGSGYYAWDNNFDKLSSSGFRVLRYDLYGRGLSDRPEVNYNLKLFTDQLQELLDSLTLTPPYHLVSVSMGAMIAIEKSIRDSSNVSKLVFIDPAAIDKGEPNILLKLPLISNLLMTIYWAPRAVDKQMKEFHQPSSVKEYAAKSEVQLQYKGLRRSMLSTWRYLASRNMDEELKILGRTNKKVLLLWGKNDPLVSVKTSVKYKSYIPSLNYAEIDNAGHLANYEQADQVNQLIINFLKK